MKNVNALTCTDNFDITFADDGMLSVEKSNSGALANMLRLDFTLNDDWSLDRKLGVHWLSKNNDGFLQVKGSKNAIVSAIIRKLSSIDGIREVKSVEVSSGIDRSMYIKAVVITYTGDTLLLEKKL